MRLFAVALVAAIACAIASSAMASSFPPIGIGTLPVLKAKHSHSTTSCSVIVLKSKSAAGRFAGKLKPVACEQPPRANTNIFNLAFAYGFKF
jgi:hypothetical protein